MRYLPKSSPTARSCCARSAPNPSTICSPPFPLSIGSNVISSIPRAYAESEIVEFFRQRAADCAQGYATFLGAGAYSHYRPVVVDSLVSRGEFFTAYTPYQPEIAQGTLQSIFEFQTMICELTGMDVANASMYDGSTGAAEAMMMAARITGRHKSVIASSVHPEYREVITTYARYQGMPISTVGYLKNGRVDLEALDKAIDSETAGVLIQSPNFFGTIEDVAAVGGLVPQERRTLRRLHRRGGFVRHRRASGGGGHRQHGGASRSASVRLGGRIAGDDHARSLCVSSPDAWSAETRDRNGRRRTVAPTLSTREQHIRREEKATSNICTNQGLVASDVLASS